MPISSSMASWSSSGIFFAFNLSAVLRSHVFGSLAPVIDPNQRDFRSYDLLQSDYSAGVHSRWSVPRFGTRHFVTVFCVTHQFTLLYEERRAILIQKRIRLECVRSRTPLDKVVPISGWITCHGSFQRSNGQICTWFLNDKQQMQHGPYVLQHDGYRLYYQTGSIP